MDSGEKIKKKLYNKLSSKKGFSKKIFDVFWRFHSGPSLVGWWYQDIVDFLDKGSELMLFESVNLTKIKKTNPKGIYLFIGGDETLTLDDIDHVTESISKSVRKHTSLNFVADVGIDISEMVAIIK